MTHDIETIKRTLNLVQLVEDTGAELRYQHGEYRCACPIHHGDNKSAFAIYEHDGKMRWKCFTGPCGHGDELDFLVKWTGKPLMQVLDNLDHQVKAMPKANDTERRLRELEKKVAEQEKRISELEKWKKSEPWQRYHDEAPDTAREAWRAAGVPDEWQAFYRLGGTETFTYAADNNFYKSPTLTIPIYEHGWNCVTVRHRILRPVDPSDKYRPDMPGLGSHPFLGDPDLGYDTADRTIVVEGEKKAIVTFLTLDTQLVQVIGIPGKGIWRQVASQLKGQDVTIILDPDADDTAVKMAKEIGTAKVVNYQRKIDDTIVKYSLGKDWIRGLLQTARRVR